MSVSFALVPRRVQDENPVGILSAFKSTDFKEYIFIYFDLKYFQWFLKLKILEPTILEHE